MVIASTIGTMVGNLFSRTPFMLIFLMGDYVNAFLWATIDTIFDTIRKKYLTKRT